jgi:TrmH family RNA methyltransferase
VLVVEGPVLLADALAAGIAVTEVLHEPDAPAGLLERAGAAGAEVLAVHAGVLDGVGDAVASQGVLAIATAPRWSLEDVEPGAPVLVLAGVADPGNAGTLVRVAEATALGAVVLTAGSVDAWSPKVVRASAGSVLRVPVVTAGETREVLDALRAGGRRTLGTRADDAPAYTEADLPPDVALVLGNEAHGLGPEVAHHVDGWVRIPMAGQVESLNVAMTGTVLAFELARRRSDS